MASVPHKRCTQCDTDKPLADFYARKDVPDGRRKECKACFLAARKQHYYTRPDRDQVLNRMREYSNNRYQTNDERREYQARYLKEQRQNNPHVRERHLRWASAYKKRRRQTDPIYYEHERVRRHAQAHNKRAAIRGSGGAYTVKQWRELCTQYDHKCLRCGVKVKLLTPDHVIPVTKGGSGNISNIQPLCLPCNMWKGNKTIDYRPSIFT